MKKAAKSKVVVDDPKRESLYVSVELTLHEF